MAGIRNVYPRRWLVLPSRSLKHLNLLLVLHAMCLPVNIHTEMFIDIQNKNQRQTLHSPKELRAFQKFALECLSLRKPRTSLVYTGTSYIQQSLKSVRKFAHKVCLKQWDMNYESMLEQLGLTLLSQHRKLLKLITMYNN